MTLGGDLTAAKVVEERMFEMDSVEIKLVATVPLDKVEAE
jgi:hypothetical protein